MRHALFALALSAVLTSTAIADEIIEAGDSPERIIILRNGGMYRGEILEMEPNRHLVVRLASGAVRQFAWHELRRVALQRSPASIPTPEKFGTSRRDNQSSPPPQESVRRAAPPRVERPAPPRPLPPPREPESGQLMVVQRSAPMIAVGSTLWGVSYLVALVVGGIGLAGLDSPSITRMYPASVISQARTGIGTVMIPVLGPFISALIVQTAEWSVPWVFVGGATQVAGMAMLIAGAVGTKVPVNAPTALVLPSVSPEFTGLTALGRF